ncbi:MAG: MerR family transcriptional regulator [Ruthenibacterium sp.]
MKPQSEAKQYTVSELARLAGVSVRALHWYDKLGLLPPQSITQSGYRLYGTAQVDALQSILFYRALGVPLKSIAALCKASAVTRAETLQAHRSALLEQRRGLDALLATLDKTIRAEQGEIAMTDKEKFEGFKKQRVDENEAAYGAEVRKAYGDAAADAANAKLMHLTPEQYAAMQGLDEEILAALGAAVRAGERPDGAEGQRIAAMHRDWLHYTWPSYAKKAHAGLAQMYVTDERFTAYYDAAVPGCAQFLCDAVTAYTAEA